MPAWPAASSSRVTSTPTSPAMPTHHHHLSCSICGRVEEIPESWVSPIASRASEQLDFEIDDARLDFYGRCAACRATA